MAIDNKVLLLSAQRALLFNIIPSIRYVFIEARNDNEICMYIYTNRPLTEEEKDIYYSVLAEISGDFPEVDDSICKIDFFNSKEQYDKIDKLRWLVLQLQTINSV